MRYILVIVLALLLTGCGGGGSNFSTTTRAYTGTWSGTWTDTQTPAHTGAISIVITGDGTTIGALIDKTDLNKSYVLINSSITTDGVANEFQAVYRNGEAGQYVWHIRGPFTLMSNRLTGTLTVGDSENSTWKTTVDLVKQ